MRSIAPFLFFTCIQIASFTASAQFAANSAHLDEQIATLLNQRLPKASLGLVIVDPQTNEIVYATQENQNFYPASCTKLFTASAALKSLGPDFQYQTTLQATQPAVHNGVLTGNVAVKFTGDPSLTDKALFDLFQQLKAKKITHITGNIVIDDTAFKGPVYGPGWTLDSTMWAYSAPVSAIIINENKIKVRLEQPAKRYEVLPVQALKKSPTKVISKVIGVTREAAKTTCQIKASYQPNQILLEGCYAYEDTPKILELAINEPRDLAKASIAQYLKTLNIQLDGKITFGSTPKDAQVIALKKSPPLKTLLKPVLADSNNLYTESLTKTLGLKHYGQGSFQSGTKAMHTILNDYIPEALTQCRFEDGSGQSRYNLVSPLSIIQLLQSMVQDPNFEDYYKAFSVGGTNGTLEPRMQNALKGQVIAKTGGATGTSCLSGFFKTKSGKIYLFSMMINQFSNSIMQAKNFEDELCAILVEEPWYSN